MSGATPEAKRFDLWLAISLAIFVVYLLGCMAYFIWRIWHG